MPKVEKIIGEWMMSVRANEKYFEFDKLFKDNYDYVMKELKKLGLCRIVYIDYEEYAFLKFSPVNPAKMNGMDRMLVWDIVNQREVYIYCTYYGVMLFSEDNDMSIPEKYFNLTLF